MLKMFRFTWIIVVLVCLYLAWVFYSRWSDNRAYLGRLEGRKAAQDRAVVDAYGGNRLTIVGFYATPATIRRGDTARLCYSVSNHPHL